MVSQWRHRFYNMCKIGYMQDIALFRAIDGFMFQFGIHGDPAVNEKWSEATTPGRSRQRRDLQPAELHHVCQNRAANSRSTQMFINLGDNRSLDSQGFTPFGRIVDGIDVLEKINTEYGENRGNVQGEFKLKGNAYIKQKYPNLDFIKSATVIE